MNELREALDRLIAVMLEHGMPHQNWLLPGLRPDEVRATLTQAGYPVTEEIVTWFSWRNGASRTPDPQVSQNLAFLGGFPLSLTDSIAQARSNHELAQAQIRDTGQIYLADVPWGSGWIPVLDQGLACPAVDLTTDPVVCPVILYSWDSGPDEWETLPSLQALINIHIDLIRNDATWSPENRGWEIIWDHTTFKEEYRFF